MTNIKTIGVDIRDTVQLKESLKQQDLVLDFIYPTGQIFELPLLIKKNLENILSAVPSGATYIYMSSIHALGMPLDNKELRRYKFPWTSYGYIKKKAEKEVEALGRKHGVNTYNFRLGQVHGFMQSVSESFREKLSSAPIAYLNGNENDLTNTIFISSLADAVIKCANGEVECNIYTLIAHPQWTLAELYEYYKKFFGLKTQMVYQPQPLVKQKSLKFFVMGKLKKYRPLIESYVLLKMPDLSLKIKGRYRVNEGGKLDMAEKVSYLDLNYVGTPPTALIKDLDCAVDSVYEKEKLMQEMYLKLIKENTK